MRLSRLPCPIHRRHTAARYIDASGYGLKVIGVDAATHATQVIEIKPVWDRAPV